MTPRTAPRLAWLGAAAILVAIGSVLLMVLIRKQDVVGINPEAAPLPGA